MSLVEYTPKQRAWLELMSPAAELAKAIADTDFVPKGLRHNPPAVAAAILFGDEVGFGPMQSLAKISVIDGKPALAAEAQRALILQAGHDLWVEEATTTKVTICGRRRDSDHVNRFTWTMDDAKRANLAGRPAWRLYPRQMLLARATAELARAVFADAIGGLMAIEELEDPGEGSEVVTPGNGAETATRRKRRRTGTALSPTASSGPEPETERPMPPLPGELSEDFGGTSPTVAPEEGGASPSPPASDPDAESPDEGAPPALDEKPLTLAQSKKKMDALVAQLRKSGHIRTEHLWSSLARSRSLDVDEMILLLGGRDMEGLLHWSPLRDSLTLEEARELHARLARMWVNVQGETEL